MESTQPIDYHIMAILTFMVPFMPSILILFGIIGSFNRLYTRILETNNCIFLLFLAIPLLVLPYVQIATNTVITCFVIYGCFKDFFEIQMVQICTEKPSKSTEPPDYSADKIRPFLSMSKSAETMGESTPQAVLQIAILLITSNNLSSIWDHLIQDFEANFWSSTLVTLATSYASLITSGGSYIVENHFIINGVGFGPYMSLRLTLVNSLAMIFVVTPRLLSLSIMIAAFKDLFVFMPLSISLVAYMTGLTVLYQLFKRERTDVELTDRIGYKRFGVFSIFLSSIIMPCVIINPKWNILSYVGILSASILILNMVFIVGLIDLVPEMFNPSLIEDPKMFRLICLAIILGLILSMAVTSLQLSVIRKIHLNIFKYQVLLGDAKAVEKRLCSSEDFEFDQYIFRDACRAQQEEIVALFLKYGKHKRIDFNAGKQTKKFHQSGYYFACDFKNHNIMKMIEEKAEDLDIKLDCFIKEAKQNVE